MDRTKQLAKITKVLQNNLHKVLSLSGIKDEEISKFINKFQDMFEVGAIISYLKTLNGPCEEFLKYYGHHAPETWELLYMIEPRVPEISELEKRKSAIRKLWALRRQVFIR